MKKILAAVLGGLVLSAFAAPAAHAVSTKSCYDRNFGGDTRLTGMAVGDNTSCGLVRSAARAYMNHSSLRPRTLRAYSSVTNSTYTLRRIGPGEIDRNWEFASVQYQARGINNSWISLYLTYEW